MTIFRRSLAFTMIGLVLMFSSCGFDGGSRGSGITSTAQGNIAGVGGTSDQQGSVEGIRVTIGPRAQSVSDSAGVFSVQGGFEGHVTILFTRRTDRLRAHLPIYLPSGGTMTLNGVHIDTSTGSATVDSAGVNFLGELTRIDCAGQTLLMLAAKRTPEDTDMYAVRLDTSSLEDSQGNPLACSDLQTGQTAHVQGTVNDDDSFGHAQITIE